MTHSQDLCVECGQPASHRLLCTTCATLPQYADDYLVDDVDPEDVAAALQGEGR